MITVTELRKSYRQGGRTIDALDGVSLEVPRGTIHGVIGHSGAGKSTLVRCLTLLDRPTSGSVSIDGRDLTSIKDSEVRSARRRIGMVFQHANLLDSRTAAGNVALPLELVRLSKSEKDAKVARLLGLVGLAEFADAYPSQLSGGQRQRVGIARALAADPTVLLCDEPTSALDPATTDEILDLIRDLADTLGLTVLIITHEMNVVKRICDSVSLLEKGRVVEQGPLREVAGSLNGRLVQALLPLPPHNPSGTGPVLDLLTAGGSGSGPVLSELSRRFSLDVTLLAGSVETLAGEQFSRMRVGLAPAAEDNAPAEPLELNEVVSHLRARGVTVEVAA
ncbi:methionine ABC transporter ATP-binding protein [uncultured Arthrobacter sp.]|uniref:methionine ABC transporter ATP-binding protein n=1 Tax=uncultured Arthrobacter sp. TaxID=114050 RepID=UPI0025F60E83|nr:ATP-binding cassette domain-containing protein [uncultured Arthrobacter sp.]